MSIGDRDVIYRYWAKAGTANEPSVHLLVWHTLDVGAVALEYLCHNPLLTRRYAEWLGCTNDEAMYAVASAVALHDVGKMTASFQQKRPDVAARLGQTTDLRGWKAD